ncbi:MAG: deoxyribodipyrimidine photo-lyase, partial [Pseudomonadota bacterium]|nr:deoxyribodipyrimidine photo-lyase [Pseudomonadota bacterium]
MPTSLVWFYENLRLSDNRALAFAAQRGTVVPVYILDERAPGRAPGAASRW